MSTTWASAIITVCWGVRAANCDLGGTGSPPPPSFASLTQP